MVDLENLAEPLLNWDRLLAPIPGDNPSGPLLRYDSAYDEIREAIKPLDTAPLGVWQRDQKPPDYASVIKMAGDFIATKSKDLDVAGWLTEALTRKHQLAGMCEGLLLFRKLLEDFWDSVYPALDPEDGEAFRAKPIKHLNRMFVAVFLQLPIAADGRTLREYNSSRSDGDPPVEEVDRSIQGTSAGFYEALVDQIAQTRQAVTLLQKICDEKFQTGDRPYLEKLCEQLDGLKNTAASLLRRKPAPAPAQVAKPAPPPPAAPAPSGPALGETPASSTTPAPAPWQTPAPPPSPVTVHEMAAAMRREDSANPVPYMLVRSWAFGPLLARGTPVSEDLLEPPPTELRTALRRAALGSSWQEVLNCTERGMELPCGACWLDLQFYSQRACTELQHEGAANAIRGMLAGYLRALPDLEGLVMLDGSPVANPETAQWIRSAVLVDPQQVRKQSLEQVASFDFDKQAEIFEGAPPDAYEVASSELQAGRFNEAFRVLSEALAKETTGRGRMQRKLQLAKIAMEAGEHRIAHPLLREIHQMIETRRLEGWESAELIAPPLAMLYHCLNTLGENGELKQHVYEQLCAVDPLKALEIASHS
jgi:type VI secretion system protein ImpA